MIELVIDSWEELRAFVLGPPPTDTTYYWRGQKDPAWPLSASLERRVLELCGPAEQRGQQRRQQADPAALGPDLAARYERLSREHLAAFQNSCSGLRGPSPKDLTEEQWWALGRHYGLLTPLLDWTEKPYIALFFSLKGFGPLGGHEQPSLAGDRFALYRLSHTPALQNETLRVVKTPIDELGRMQQQRGLFTWITSGKHFELQGLLDSTGRGALLTKALISVRLIPDVLADLNLHGIDHRLLFPDMYGAASHANALLELERLLDGSEGPSRGPSQGP